MLEWYTQNSFIIDIICRIIFCVHKYKCIFDITYLTVNGLFIFIYFHKIKKIIKTKKLS